MKAITLRQFRKQLDWFVMFLYIEDDKVKNKFGIDIWAIEGLR